MRCMLSIFDHTEADRAAEMGECGGDRLCWQWILYRPGHLHNTGSQEGGCKHVHYTQRSECNIYCHSVWQQKL